MSRKGRRRRCVRETDRRRLTRQGDRGWRVLWWRGSALDRESGLFKIADCLAQQAKGATAFIAGAADQSCGGGGACGLEALPELGFCSRAHPGDLEATFESEHHGAAADSALVKNRGARPRLAGQIAEGTGQILVIAADG